MPALINPNQSFATDDDALAAMMHNIEEMLARDARGEPFVTDDEEKQAAVVLYKPKPKPIKSFTKQERRELSDHFRRGSIPASKMGLAVALEVSAMRIRRFLGNAGPTDIRAVSNPRYLFLASLRGGGAITQQDFDSIDAFYDDVAGASEKTMLKAMQACRRITSRENTRIRSILQLVETFDQLPTEVQARTATYVDQLQTVARGGHPDLPFHLILTSQNLYDFNLVPVTELP